MLNAEIIAVGTELLLGQICNTNAQYLSKRLAEIGVNVFHHTVVGDNPRRLVDIIEQAEARADLLIFTGGLGPTQDDLTKEIVSKHLNRQVVRNEAAWEKIQDYFKRTGRNMTSNNEKQAYVIEGAKVLQNDHGMAPGMFVQSGGNFYMLLPGPPHEMKPMYENYGREAIIQQMGSIERIESRELRFFGIGEAQIADRLTPLIESQSNPTVAPLAGEGDVSVRLTARSTTKEKAIAMLDEIEEKVQEKVGDYFYGYDDASVRKELLKQLEAQKLTVAAAESLTAGLFQSEMASVSGVSAILLGGIVCYSNKAKIELCNIRQETIEQYGAVSEQCALELAANVRKLLAADIGISFTGVAGPDSLEGYPPGTIWIGISQKGKEPKAHLIKLVGTRNRNRKRTVDYGCYYLLQHLLEKETTS